MPISNDEQAQEVTLDEVARLRRENELLSMNVDELTRTNEFLVTATWREREMKQRLHATLEELKETKKLVDLQHKSITDSINYASQIQDAIVPREGILRSRFCDAFIYFQAKDIVSGDFPWFHETEKYYYVAAVDCTGHGVPGAMMSLIGNLLLNDLVEKGAPDPAALLGLLHAAVVRTLKQDEDSTQMADGMDIAMCRVDRQTNEVQFSGAHRPLLYVSNGVMQLYGGDKFPIGGKQYKGKNAFTNAVLNPKPGDSIFFFSDGLTDQFGGPDGMKIGGKRIREFLMQNSSLSMTEQSTAIRQEMQRWLGERKPIDDVLLIGIKF